MKYNMFAVRVILNRETSVLAMLVSVCRYGYLLDGCKIRFCFWNMLITETGLLLTNNE